MTISRYVLLAVFLSIGLPVTGVFCQDVKPLETVSVLTSPVKAWTIEDCLQRAMEYNPSVRSARAGLRAASGSNLMAVSEFVPHLSWSTVYIQNDKTLLGSLAAAMPGLSPSMASDYYYMSTLSADLTLFSWRMKPLRSTVKSNSRLARLKLASAMNDLTLNVKKAFYTALYARQLLIIAQTAEDVARENLETTESLYKVGESLHLMFPVPEFVRLTPKLRLFLPKILKQYLLKACGWFSVFPQARKWILKVNSRRMCAWLPWRMKSMLL